MFGTQAGSKSCKSEFPDGSAGTSPLNPHVTTTPLGFCLGSAVYVRYKDHVLFKNISQPIAEAIKRETIGWLTKQNDEIMLIEHDRTIPNLQLPNGQGSGVIILKSCIIEIHELPLQKNSEWHLNSQENKDKGEYALQPKKRKTHPKRGKDGDKCKR
jgi:hypothetical protein